MRSKLERDLKRKTTELSKSLSNRCSAADNERGPVRASSCCRRKHELEAETERLKEELTQLTTRGRGREEEPDRVQGRNPKS